MGKYDLIVKNGTIVTPKSTILDGVVAVSGKTIVYVGDAQGLHEDTSTQTILADDCIVVPGLVDLHLHGGGGFDVMEDDLQAFSTTIARHGVTGFLPTIVPQPPKQLATTVSRLATVVTGAMPGAQSLGMHLEGPFLSPQQAGCLASDLFRKPDPDELSELIRLANGAIKRMTLAIELPGARELLPILSAARAQPSLGHSAATYAEVMAAVQSGLRHATHCFNAMSGFHHRSPGAVGAILRSPDIFAELIADGVHVHPAAVELLHGARGADRIMLVSDAVPPAGMPDGVYSWMGHELVVANGICSSQGHLAGSLTLLDAALRFLTTQTSIPLIDAVRMASLTPAVALGLQETKGSLSPGKDADLAIFDRNWRCRATIVSGNIVWLDDLRVSQTPTGRANEL